MVGTDIVCYKWTYDSGQLGAGITVSGGVESYHNVRHLMLHSTVPPCTNRVMMNAVCVAKLYTKINSTMSQLPCIKKYIQKHKISIENFSMFRIAHPKPVVTPLSIWQRANSTGKLVKLISCATIGSGSMMYCHPGAVDRYTTNRYTYKLSELRIIDIGDVQHTHRQMARKLRASRKMENRAIPTTLDDVNGGLHRGCTL